MITDPCLCAHASWISWLSSEVPSLLGFFMFGFCCMQLQNMLIGGKSLAFPVLRRGTEAGGCKAHGEKSRLHCVSDARWGLGIE
mmetsp:Transcript_8834/g.19407  ORF Transcript_8834/g.19407 Transcript_8834/m.19407 type:complete len:84 (+) Transcript_8834:128-379(+)